MLGSPRYTEKCMMNKSAFLRDLKSITSLRNMYWEMSNK